jgi:hypothetical protein
MENMTSLLARRVRQGESTLRISDDDALALAREAADMLHPPGSVAEVLNEIRRGEMEFMGVPVRVRGSLDRNTPATPVWNGSGTRNAGLL